MTRIMRTTIKQTSEFTINVIRIVKKIPKGKVATYGQIAKLAGKPHGARGVSWILHACSKTHHLPWQRVLGAKGTISFHKKSSSYGEQKKLLQAEGIKFLESDLIDLDTYRWKPGRSVQAKTKAKSKSNQRPEPKMFR